MKRKQVERAECSKEATGESEVAREWKKARVPLLDGGEGEKPGGGVGPHLRAPMDTGVGVGPRDGAPTGAPLGMQPQNAPAEYPGAEGTPAEYPGVEGG